MTRFYPTLPRTILALGVALAAVCGSAQTAPPGALDASFNPQANDTVYAVAVQPNGQILIGGAFTKVNGGSQGGIVRLNSDGLLDSAFLALAGADNAVRCLAVQTNGLILVGGDFSSINGMNWSRIARLNADGTVDSTCSQLTGANARVHAIAADGEQILVGGDFTKVNGITHNGLARLNLNGSLDTPFNPSFNGSVYAVAVLGSGKILVGGDFTTLNGQPAKYLALLNSDGSADASFAAPADFTVYAITLQSDGRPLVGGVFGRVANHAHSGLARLNADATIDELFTAGTSGTVYALAVQSDDMVLVGGRFSFVNTIARNNIARLNANGLLDTGFDAGEGPSYSVRTLAVEANGRILLGGEFTTVAALDHNYLARLNGNPPPSTGEEMVATAWRAVEIGWNSVTNATYQVQWASEFDTNTWFNFGPSVPGNGTTNSVFDSTRNGSRKFYRVKKL